VDQVCIIFGQHRVPIRSFQRRSPIVYITFEVLFQRYRPLSFKKTKKNKRWPKRRWHCSRLWTKFRTCILKCLFLHLLCIWHSYCQKICTLLSIHSAQETNRSGLLSNLASMVSNGVVGTLDIETRHGFHGVTLPVSVQLLPRPLPVLIVLVVNYQLSHYKEPSSRWENGIRKKIKRAFSVRYSVCVSMQMR